MVTSEKSKIIVLLSGGIDSAACVCYYTRNNFPTSGLFIDYGQIAAKNELNSAKKIAKHYQIGIDVIKTDTSMQFKDGEIRGRNAFLLFSCLMKYPNFSGIISLGIHAGVPYYDTTEKFVNDMNRIFAQYTNGTVQLEAPFLNWQKYMVWILLSRH